MPNIKSAAKRMRTSAIARNANRAEKARILTARKKLDLAAADPDKPKKEAIYRKYASIVDKAAKKGVIKRNKAARSKSRAARRLGI